MELPASQLPGSLSFAHRRPSPRRLNREGFGQYAQGYLGGGLRADVQTCRHADPIKRVFVHAAIFEELQNRLTSLLAAKQANVRRLGLQDGLEHGNVVFVVMRRQNYKS